MWLLLKNNISLVFKFNKCCTYLLPLSKVNIIVGKNNSGKSYLMRQIIKNTISVLNRDKIKEYVFEDKNFKDFKLLRIFEKVTAYREINNKYLNILRQIENFNLAKYESGSILMGTGPIYNFNNFHELVNDSKELIEYANIQNINFTREFSDEVVYKRKSLTEKVIQEYKNILFSNFDEIDDEEIYQFGEILFAFGYVKSIANEFKQLYNQPDPEGIPDAFKNYIPLMRSIRDPLKNPKEKLNQPTENIFKNRILQEYEYNENEVNVITGLDFYFDYKKKLLGSKQDRESVNKFENFLSIYFFEGKDVSIIPDEETYELKINIEDKKDKFIYEVGDGVASLIIIMYKIFINNSSENNIYFIEEPEQSFHPGFQRLFMNIISFNEKFNNCYFFFTTHSNHLIDISNNEFKNFTNYLCTKEINEINVKIQSEVDVEAIEELGVRPSSVQIANKIIWVEGKYDAFYIRLLLNKKNVNEKSRKYIEEYDYVFVPYGGSNGTLINFSIENNIKDNKEFILRAKKINKNMLLIMDDDGISTGRSNNSKKKRYEELHKELGKCLYKLEVREIENLFPEDVVKKYFCNGLKNKKVNMSFLDNINYNDYKNEKLGFYLNKLVENNLGKDLKKFTGRENGFESKGFLYDKSKFYDCVLEWIMSENFDYEKDLPEETKKLINIIEEFIKK